MNESKKRFVDQLLAADPPSADARQNYEKGMRTMLEKTLTPGERRGYLVIAIVFGLIGLVAATIPSLNALFGWPSPPIQAGPEWKFIRTWYLLSGMALLAVAAIFFRYRRGMVSQRQTNDWTAGTAVGFTGVLGCLFLFMARGTPEMLGDELQVLGLVLVVYAAVAWVRHQITQAEMRTAEKLLEIELRVAEIGEALQARPTPADPASAKQPTE